MPTQADVLIIGFVPYAIANAQWTMHQVWRAWDAMATELEHMIWRGL
jgi:hypothetical protein